MPYYSVADSFHTNKLCSRLYFKQSAILVEKRPFCIFETPLWGVRGNVRCSSLAHWKAHSSSSSSRNEYYLGDIIAVLLQDHHTVSTKSVCSSQYMASDQHWATGEQIKHSTLSDRIREWQPEHNGLQW